MYDREDEMDQYRYTESGLDNVWIEGLPPVQDDEGDVVYTIPNINGLHRAIAQSIIDHPKGMSGKELRFLRTEMGLTQAELARVLHREQLAVGRWERGEVDIDSNAEALIRHQASEELGLRLDVSTRVLSERCVPTADVQTILIDGTDPSEYRQIAA